MSKPPASHALVCAVTTIAIAASGYNLLKKMPVGGIGGWDYLVVDDVSRRLYVSHETQVEVLDADSGDIVGKIPNTSGVHGIAIATESNRGFTSNGNTSTVTIFDLRTLAVIGDIQVGKKPDAIVYDPASRRVFVMNGKGSSSTAIDAASGKVAGTLDLNGGPEFAVADGEGNVFVNLEQENLVVRIDSKNLLVRDRWPLAPCKAPSSMAMDRVYHRLFIGCRSGVMAVLNSDSGKVVSTYPIGGHVDASAFDPATKLVFNSTGEGTVDILHQDSPDDYSLIQRLATRAGSKTMALDPKTHQLYVPASGTNGMEILVYRN